MLPIDAVSAIVVDEAVAVHRELGPGLFETVYETVLAGRVEMRGLKVGRQVPVPLMVDGHFFDAAFRIDLLIDERLVLEIKAVDQLSKAHASKQSARKAVANLSANPEAACRATSQFFCRHDEGRHSKDGQ